MKLHLGLDDVSARKTADSLEVVLANTFVLYTKTLNFHWNVVGADFSALHGLFEKQYEMLLSRIDTLAERIRTLGFRAPGTLVEYLRLTILREVKEDLNDAEMVQNLLDDHEVLAVHIRQHLPEIDKNDAASRTLLEELLGDHEKTAWMLRSHLLRN